MAAPTNTYQTYTHIGQREDLQDIVYDISPMDTPFLTNAGRVSADATFHEWQTDSLAAASTTNAHIEGSDSTADAAVATYQYGNRCQIFKKIPRVSGTLRAVDVAGRNDELSYQMAKRSREIKRDIETTLLSTNPATTGAAAGARQLAGVATWLFDNQTQLANGSTTPTITSGAPDTAPTAGSAAAFTEASLKANILACWNNGGEPKVVMTGGTNKQTASGFDGIATQYRDVQSSPTQPGSIVGAADYYVSDFGGHQIVANRFMPQDNVYCLDMEYWAVAYLRPMQQEPLSKTGDSDRRQILAELTLCAKEPRSSGKIYTTT